MKIIALLVQALLWGSIAFSPTLVGVAIGIILKFSFAGLVSKLALPVCIAIGFIVGGIWAERIRKTIGLSMFFGRLNGHRDIDGLPK